MGFDAVFSGHSTAVSCWGEDYACPSQSGGRERTLLGCEQSKLWETPFPAVMWETSSDGLNSRLEREASEGTDPSEQVC